MKKQIIPTFFSALLIIVLAGCGTTSSLSHPDSDEIPDLSNYDSVVVLNFASAVDLTDMTKTEREIAQREIAEAGAKLADELTIEIERNKVFATTSREPLTGNAVVISGVITRFSEGNASLRMWIGLGAGSSYFDAEVYFSDNITGDALGNVIIDRNSWPLGGGVAAAQNIDFYIDEAARQITRDLMEARGMEVPKLKPTDADERGGSRR